MLSGLAMLAAAWAGAEPTAAQESSASPPRADSGIEEIVVLGGESDSSADFAAADSVTGFGAEDLAALGAQTIADLASFTPNLEIVTAGATTPTFFIRGVGLNDFNPNSTGAVAIYQDDVAINAPALQLGTLFDVEAVNILRGPQGTGMGRNASAGAIKIYARKPTGEFGGFLRGDFGNFSYQDYEGAFEAPILEDQLAGRFAFRLSKRDGTMKNRCGSAPSFEARLEDSNGDGVGDMQVPRPFPAGTSPTQGPWSICGEPVFPGTGRPGDPLPKRLGISDVPPGLEDHVNNTDNWAARGTLLFQPTLDMSWLLNAHGSRRDEVTRLGQSIGTRGIFCLDDKICTAPFAGVPPELVDRDATSVGLLGAPQGGGDPDRDYWPREIRARLFELAPCFEDNSCNQDLETRLAANRAKIQLANELAKDLDSEPWEGDFNRTGPTTSDTWGGYLKGDIVLPGEIHVTTTSGFDSYDRLVDIDLDFSPETLFQIVTADESWQFYQDLSFAGQLGEASPLRWEVGGWFLREVLDATVVNDFGILTGAGVGSRVYTQGSSNAAGYGYVSLDFWDDFTLDGGLRYNWDNKDLTMDILSAAADFIIPESCSPLPGRGAKCDLNETWHAPTGTVRLTYRFREDTHAFWKYTRGWKPGTFNATASQLRGPTIAEPEKIDSFEAGLRGSWFQGRFGLDTSLFYYSYENYQIFTAKQFIGGNPEFVIINASDAEVYGAEIDTTARPWAGAFWNVRFSWLESQFLDFVQRDELLENSGGGFEIIFRETQNSGNPLLNSPRFKVSITGEQTVPLGRYGALTARYDGVWTDTTFYDATEGLGIPNVAGAQFLPEDTIGQEAFWLHNLRLSWRTPNGRIELAGWVRNLLDTSYKTFAFDASTFSGTTIYFVGDPRTYGVSLMVNF